MIDTKTTDKLDHEDQVRNESIKRVLDDLRDMERRLLGNDLWHWLESIKPRR